MKRYLSLIILALVTAGLAGVYFMINANTDPTSTGQLYSISPSDSIKEIKISNNFGVFLFNREDGVWMLKEPGNYHVNQQKMDLMEAALLDLQINRMLESELPEYGLTKPSIIVEFSTSQNVHKTFYVGNLAPSNAQIYLKDVDSGKIFIADIGTTAQFDGSLKAYRGSEVFSINKDQISEITYIQNGIKKLTIKYLGPQNWQLTDPISAPARYLEISEMIIKMRKWTSAGYPENMDGNYDQYGLVNPANVLLLTDSNRKTQRIEFGNTENGMIYARTGSQEDIIKLFSVDIDFSILTVDQLLFVEPLQTTLENVSEIKIDSSNRSSTFILDHSKDPVAITLSGKEVTYDDFVSLFVKYITLSADGYDTQTQPGSKYLSLTTTYTDRSTMSINLLQRDESSYFMEISGKPIFFIYKDKVDQFLNRWDSELAALK